VPSAVEPWQGRRRVWIRLDLPFGQWKSPEMSARYINGGVELRNRSIDLFRT
jgi:hypothetical protein